MAKAALNTKSAILMFAAAAGVFFVSSASCTLAADPTEAELATIAEIRQKIAGLQDQLARQLIAEQPAPQKMTLAEIQAEIVRITKEKDRIKIEVEKIVAAREQKSAGGGANEIIGKIAAIKAQISDLTARMEAARVAESAQNLLEGTAATGSATVDTEGQAPATPAGTTQPPVEVKTETTPAQCGTGPGSPVCSTGSNENAVQTEQIIASTPVQPETPKKSFLQSIWDTLTKLFRVR
jgi:hypothetical protein